VSVFKNTRFWIRVLLCLPGSTHSKCRCTGLGNWSFLSFEIWDP